MHDEATPEALPHQEDGALPLGGLGDGRVQAVEVGGQRFLGGRDPPHARVFAVLAALHQDHTAEDRQLPLLEEEEEEEEEDEEGDDDDEEEEHEEDEEDEEWTG